MGERDLSIPAFISNIGSDLPPVQRLNRARSRKQDSRDRRVHDRRPLI
jgi:hypothetical protein